MSNHLHVDKTTGKRKKKKKKERERTVEQTKTNTDCLNFPLFFHSYSGDLGFFLINQISFLVCSYCLMFEKRGQIKIRYFCFIFFKCRKEKTF